jgi:hypothetical protein
MTQINAVEYFKKIQEAREQCGLTNLGGLSESKTSETILDIPDGLRIQELDQINLSNLIEILTEEGDEEWAKPWGES